MAPSVEKKARIRVSKNRKKAWGKHCDIKDVEEFLEEQRFDERTGGPVYEKPDEELFFVDTSSIQADVEKPSKDIKSLKCHRHLGSYSKVEPPVNPQKRPLGKKKRKLLERQEEKKVKRTLNKPKQREKIALSEFHDLWGQPKEKNDPEIEHLINYRDEVTKTRSVKVPAHRYQKPSLLPAVEVPHPGASYNPSYKDHQELLSNAVQIEQKKVKEELHLKRVLFDMFPTKANAPSEKTWMEEMSQGLFDGDAKDGSEVPIADAHLYANPPVAYSDKKTKSKRRRQIELKYLSQQQALEKQAKRKISDIFRIKSMKSEIKKAEEESKERQARKQQREIEKMYKPRTLSKYKFEPNDLEVNLSEQLPDSMRALKVEGNIFEDRYKSLQKRNLIETRVKQNRKRKYKLKVQVKRSHRDFQ